MDEVGRLFGSGQLIVAEVLVSAEVMQTAVDRLSPHLHGEAMASRGSLLLATVRGDVHDIGKNLVNIIFSTNGYRVVDLGVQCPSDRLIAGWQEHRTDLIGLSGLLVRSAHQMVGHRRRPHRGRDHGVRSSWAAPRSPAPSPASASPRPTPARCATPRTPWPASRSPTPPAPLRGRGPGSEARVGSGER